MGIDVIQLKPHQESFYVIVFGKLAPLNAVVLCEGHSDAEIAKRILKKMEGEGVIGGISLKVGFTDVGGRDNVPRMLDAILSLTRSSRRLKDIVVVVDGDEYSVDDRVKSIVDSLVSRGALIEGLQRDSVCNQVYVSRVTVDRRSLRLLIAVNGDYSMPFKRRCLEDHCVKLMGRRVVEGVESSKRLVSVDECLEYIGGVDARRVCEVFDHICRVFQITLSEITG
jgi:DNA-binding Lrp family transcriptional regulator